MQKEKAVACDYTYTKVRESFACDLPPDLIHTKVAIIVTQHRPNSVHPRASTVSDCRHLLANALSSWGR